MPRSLKPHLFRKEGWGLLFYRGPDSINRKEKDTEGLWQSSDSPFHKNWELSWFAKII